MRVKDPVKGMVALEDWGFVGPWMLLLIRWDDSKCVYVFLNVFRNYPVLFFSFFRIIGKHTNRTRNELYFIKRCFWPFFLNTFFAPVTSRSEYPDTSGFTSSSYSHLQHPTGRSNNPHPAPILVQSGFQGPGPSKLHQSPISSWPIQFYLFLSIQCLHLINCPEASSSNTIDLVCQLFLSLSDSLSLSLSLQASQPFQTMENSVVYLWNLGFISI